MLGCDGAGDDDDDVNEAPFFFPQLSRFLNPEVDDDDEDDEVVSGTPERKMRLGGFELAGAVLVRLDTDDVAFDDVAFPPLFPAIFFKMLGVLKKRRRPLRFFSCLCLSRKEPRRCSARM